MNHYYKDYCWKTGFPYGLGKVDPTNEEKTIKIVTDPYNKHISIEEYRYGQYSRSIYDSRFLDFRKLKPVDQTAWQKETVSETQDQIICLIRNLEDRVVYIEVYQFRDNICIECRTYSPHDILLSIQKMFYTPFEDSFNGVILFDNNEHAVMFKRYAIDQENQFTELLEEEWDLQKNPAPSVAVKR